MSAKAVISDGDASPFEEEPRDLEMVLKLECRIEEVLSWEAITRTEDPATFRHGRSDAQALAGRCL